MSTRKAPAPSGIGEQPKAKRGGPRPGSGRKPKAPGEIWKGGRPATRGDVRGRIIQAVAATEDEAEYWRTKARSSGAPLEVFFASILRDALGSP
jgi:hypothetical protein